MKKLLPILMVVISYTTFAATTLKNVNTKPKAGLILKIEGEGGTNGSAVAWYPSFSLYYTLIAGNADYPLEAFDERGNNVQSTTPNADMRGLWYNDGYEMLEGNSYNTHNIISFFCDEDGMIVKDDEPVIEVSDLNITEPQAVICYNSEDEVYVWYDQANNLLGTLDMELGDEGDNINLNLKGDNTNINFTTVIYTGIKGAEYGLLDYKAKQVLLINKDNGKVATTIKLPSNAVTQESYGFSFANDNIWLYDTDLRQWTGYKIIK